MHYVLLSSTGNLIEAHDSEADARAALSPIVQAEPEVAEDVALIVYDDDGMPVGDPVFLPTSAARAEFAQDGGRRSRSIDRRDGRGQAVWSGVGSGPPELGRASSLGSPALCGGVKAS